ncbi:MAG: hypothetical protein LBB67_07835 [Oscillospiraceae bacterium]|jgi:hypothetical protein|nr:hypothetical protein [Oscillospiraceae bacterium]
MENIHKSAKRLLVLLLCVAMLVPMLAIAPSAANASSGSKKTTDLTSSAKKKSKQDYDPIIVVPGIGQSPVDYYNEDGSLAVDDDGNELGGYFKMIVIDTRNIVDVLLKNLLVPALLTLAFQWDLCFSDAITPILDSLLSPHKTTPDGKLVNDLRARRIYKSVANMEQADRDMFYRQIPVQSLIDTIGEKNAYFFAYSLMGDAIQTAKELDQYIQFVLKDAKPKSGKVTLVNVSLGGSVYVAYLDMFKNKNQVSSVINMVAVLDGSDALGDLFARNFNLNDKYFYSGLIPDLLDTLGLGLDENLTKMMGTILRILPRKAYEHLLSRAFDWMHSNIFINNAQMWACVPLARYKGLRDKYLTDDAHKDLLAKVDKYFEMQARFNANTLEVVNKKGWKVNNIAGYGLHFGDVEYPIFGAIDSTAKSNCDGIIQIFSTAQGAKSVTAGTKFPGDYKQVNNSKAHPGYSYISPNRSVDASTCVLPDNTWFFEDQHHEVGRNDILINLATALIVDDKLVNVHSKPDVYPQFNFAVRTDWMRRDWIPSAKALLADKGLNLSPEVVKQLKNAIAASETFLKSTIGDAEKYAKVRDNLFAALRAAGKTDISHAETEPDLGEQILSWLTTTIDEAMFYVVGGRGYSDWWRLPKYPGFFNGEGVCA